LVLIHTRFVFVHHQKCGGTFIREVLKRELGQEALEESISHAGWDSIPSTATGLPVLCYVRNPWDWYVSWYESKHQHPEARGELFNRLSDDDSNDFKQTIMNACELRHAGGNEGLCTASFLYAAGGGLDSGALTVGRFETLIDDLDGFLREAGAGLPDGAVDRARTAQPVNAVERGPYRDYYDDELRELVGDSSRTLIDRFGYGF
jgi:hypothetical protein